MTRRCSHCSNNGHNSRTCPTRTGAGAAAGGGVRLFGVRLTEGGSMIMKKSASVGCLSHYAALSPSASASPGHQLDSPPSDPQGDHDDRDAEGYASDDPNHASCSANRRAERKKGIPWTEEEHRMFLVGLQKLGKGDWRGIARKFVVSRTPTQVASHAQKYFIRQSNASRRKRRSSLFDMVPDTPMDQVPATEDQFERSPPQSDSTNSMPSLDLTLERDSMTAEPVTEKSTTESKDTVVFSNIPPLSPTYYPLYPIPYPYWPSSMSMLVKEDAKTHEVLKPTPVLAKDQTKTDELLGLSNLSLGEVGSSCLEPSTLSSKLLSDSSSRQSAFHANPAVAGSDLSQNNSGNAIHAL